MSLSASKIADAFAADFSSIFGGPPKERVVILTPIITAAEDEDQSLDPASQTGDFVLPNGSKSPIFTAPIEEVDVSAEIERHYRDLDEAFGVETGHIHDLTHEEVRIYHFPDGVEVEVTNPHTLTILSDGTHQITPFDRVGVEIPPRWVKLEVFPKQGEACFEDHPPANEIG